MSLIPWYYRWLAIGLLSTTLVAFGWIKGAGHVQQQWDAMVSADKIVMTKVKAVQTVKTQEINHETNRLIARSDAYWGLRQPSLPSGVPRSSGGADAETSADALDPARRVEGSECSPADGAADAILILQWQRWVVEMKKATNEGWD
ncbi:MAG TPA: hypothetical protein VGK09_08450 [Rhodocyclaceae bacterium]|jgi:hypothetical protein